MPSHSPGPTTSRCKTTCSFSSTTSPRGFSRLGYVNRKSFSVSGTCSDAVLSCVLPVQAAMSSIKTVVKVMLCRILFFCAAGLRVLRNDVRFGSLADLFPNTTRTAASGGKPDVERANGRHKKPGTGPGS